jgi:hypothetical protein
MWFLNIPVLRQGNVIEMMPRGASEPKRLAVVEACSGIRSLMTLITLAVIYAYFTKPKAAAVETVMTTRNLACASAPLCPASRSGVRSP